MREIKYRQLVNGEFHYWGIGLTDTQGYHSSFIGPMCGGRIRADQTPHDQYTGLKDVNGVEIYEGDILKGDPEGNIRLVGELLGGFVASDPDDVWDYVLLGDYDFYVIGNIHLNPELLEVKE